MIICLTVVLPQLPVTDIIGIVSYLRYSLAKARKPLIVLPQTICGISNYCFFETKIALAPLAIALGIKSCPSRLATIATNKQFCLISFEFMATVCIETSSPKYSKPAWVASCFSDFIIDKSYRVKLNIF